MAAPTWWQTKDADRRRREGEADKITEHNPEKSPQAAKRKAPAAGTARRRCERLALETTDDYPYEPALHAHSLPETMVMALLSGWKDAFSRRF